MSARRGILQICHFSLASLAVPSQREKSSDTRLEMLTGGNAIHASLELAYLKWDRGWRISRERHQPGAGYVAADDRLLVLVERPIG